MTQATLFAISDEQLSAENAGRRHAYAATLAAVIGNGADWEYNGVCFERQRADGKCACGHLGIRFEFVIQHKTDRREVIVGSTCINYYASINPDMVAGIAADMERFEKQAAERLKAAKSAARDREIQAALDEYDAIAWELDRRLSDGAEPYNYKNYDGSPAIGYVQRRRLRRDVYFGWTSAGTAATRWHNRTEGQRHPTRWKQYKSKSAFLKCIRAEIERVKSLSAGCIWE